MGNSKKLQPAQSTGGSPVNLLLTGVVCLGVGLVIGYYFGRQYAEVSAPAGVPAAQSQAPVSDPAAFLQNEANLKTMLTANSKDLNALIQLGNLYYDHARYGEAVEWYGKALAIDPKNPDVRTDRGTSYWNLNQPDAAIAEFKKALESSPGHAQTLYNLGVVYLHGKNDLAAAKQTWQALLAAHPNYPDRAKVEQQIASLANPPEAPAAGASNPAKPGAPRIEDLLDRMKSRP